MACFSTDESDKCSVLAIGWVGHAFCHGLEDSELAGCEACQYTGRSIRSDARPHSVASLDGLARQRIDVSHDRSEGNSKREHRRTQQEECRDDPLLLGAQEGSRDDEGSDDNQPSDRPAHGCAVIRFGVAVTNGERDHGKQRKQHQRDNREAGCAGRQELSHWPELARIAENRRSGARHGSHERSNNRECHCRRHQDVVEGWSSGYTAASQYEGGESTEEEHLRRQMDPTGNRVVGGKRLDRAEEGQQVGTPTATRPPTTRPGVPKR